MLNQKVLKLLKNYFLLNNNENIAYINSKFINFNEAKIHIEDRGLQFADSVYEVIAVVNKNLLI